MAERPPEVPPGARRIPAASGEYAFWVVGDQRAVLRDAYHTFLRLRWSVSLALIALGFFVVNVVFALVYYAIGGIEGARDGSFVDALSFSVQTFATIGYGAMNPKSGAANAVMIFEAITSLILTALVTGLVFAKFSRATARVAFTQHCVIATHERMPTLMFRVGNRRANVIVDAHLRVIASFKRITAEGSHFYKLHDLPLVRDRMAGMRRGWTAMHVVDATSPFFGLDSEALAKAEVELEIALTGHDDVTMQTVHAIHIYTDTQIKPGHKFVDLLTPIANGDLVIDLNKFDTVVPDTDARASVAP